VSAVYLTTLVVTAMILWGVDRLPLFEDPMPAFKRCVLVAVPASFSATIVDSLH